MQDKEELTVKFLKLRILVAYLGEKSQFNWWDTNLLNETGEKFISYSFPRSTFLASIMTISEAAKHLHDQKVGKGLIFHLFRLPFNLEEKIFFNLKNNSLDYKQLILNQDTAISYLEKTAHEKINAPEGPVQVGVLNKIETDYAIEEIGKHYLDAFQSNKQIFPYFKG